MVKKSIVIGSLVLFLLGLSASPVLAFGNPHGMPSQSQANGIHNSNLDNSNGTGIADEGDNAHPSGKDRSVEHGHSFPQGKAQSDPDDDGRGLDRSNSGQDQIGGPGGVNLEDQDNNNGCGNDDDFEDDNEGLCGGKNKDKDNPGDADDNDVGGNNDGGNIGDNNDNSGSKSNPTDSSGSVLGATNLPNTGPGNSNFLILSMLLGGLVLRLVVDRKEAQTIVKRK